MAVGADSSVGAATRNCCLGPPRPLFGSRTEPKSSGPAPSRNLSLGQTFNSGLADWEQRRGLRNRPIERNGRSGSGVERHSAIGRPSCHSQARPRREQSSVGPLFSCPPTTRSGMGPLSSTHFLTRHRRTKDESDTIPTMDEGRKRVMAIVAGILVARHLKTTEDLFDSKSSPRSESLVAAAVQWAERIMRKIDGVYR